MTFEQPVSYVWDAADIVANQSELYAILHDLKALQAYVNCVFHCKCTDHNFLINDYCDQLVYAFKNAASLSVKLRVKNIIKPYWSVDLSRLKRLSIEAHNMWNYQGCPRHGIYNDKR